MLLTEHLDDIRNDLLRGGVFTSEASVSQGIVLRLLDALGWPRYNMQVTIPEYSIEGGRVDFALCHPPLEPLVFIEIKQVGQIEGAERQLFEYAFHRGVPIAILTDGREWYFFHPGGQGTYQERRVCKLDLIDMENEKTSDRLNRYLNYDSIRAGDATRAIEDDYRDSSEQKQIEKSLPEVWNKLVEDEDELLIEVVADKTKILRGYQPTRKQVLTFLRSLGREGPPPESSPHPPPDKGSPKHLDVTMPNGDRINYRTSIDTFAAVIEKLGINQVRSVYPDLTSTSKSRKYGRQIGQYYINSNTSTPSKKRMLEQIAGQLGVQLKVKIVSKN